jgi:hypothetical protein
VDKRSRFHLVGLAIGALAAIWAAFQGDWWFAVLFAVGTLSTGAGVLYRILQERDR